jgi:S1-C subfamily serine protease
MTPEQNPFDRVDPFGFPRTPRQLPPRPPSHRTLRIFLLAIIIFSCALFGMYRGSRNSRALSSWAGRNLWSDSVVHGSGLSTDELNNIDIYKTASTATVYITSTTVQRDFFYEPYASQALGSGFLVNEQGFILTNYHVVSGSQRLQVTMADQTQYEAKALDIDRSDDLALIQIKPKGKVTYLHLGDSDHLQVGQKVLAIGNPFGFAGTLTTGVVSSIGRTIAAGRNEQKLEGLIQTDAAINSGNSGGPLLDSSGNVIGINTAILGSANIGIGFAMPINRAKALLSDYQAGRVTERPKLGVSTVYVAGDLARALRLPREGGLLIQGIQRGGSAAAAGLRGPKEAVQVGNYELYIGGDLIMELDGQRADQEDSLARLLANKRVGDTIELTVFRSEKKMKVPVKLIQAPDQAQ